MVDGKSEEGVVHTDALIEHAGFKMPRLSSANV